MARRRRPIAGLGRIRRLLRRLEPETQREIVVELHVTGREVEAAVRARAPKATGYLHRGIGNKVLPKSLRLQVGLLARRSAFGDPRFYGRIQDLGRKAQVVLVQRRRRVDVKTRRGTISTLRTTNGRKTREDIVATYRMKVPAMEGKRFITGRLPDLRRTLNQNLRGIFGRALARAAGGASD